MFKSPEIGLYPYIWYTLRKLFINYCFFSTSLFNVYGNPAPAMVNGPVNDRNHLNMNLWMCPKARASPKSSAEMGNHDDGLTMVNNGLTMVNNGLTMVNNG